jgi:hypothetical protein
MPGNVQAFKEEEEDCIYYLFFYVVIVFNFSFFLLPLHNLCFSPYSMLSLVEKRGE